MGHGLLLMVESDVYEVDDGDDGVGEEEAEDGPVLHVDLVNVSRPLIPIRSVI